MDKKDITIKSQQIPAATQIEIEQLKKRIRDLLESKSLPQEFLDGLRAGLEGHTF